ncbi:MAG TPA: hypothetical protein VG826_20050 [Pirellulales bacterium]|nr:hypothetical protein [Pirellulales bacterium]
MRLAPGVARVTSIVSPARPGSWIVHIADYHLVNREALAADLRNDEPNVTRADVEAEYQTVLANVRKVQPNQLLFIRWLAREHGVRIVFREGPPDCTSYHYTDMIRQVEHGQLDPAWIGAAGQALLERSIEKVLPAEDYAAYRAANPLAGNGLMFEGLENARELAITTCLSRDGPLAIVVLGGWHDLSRHAEGLGCGYMKVWVDGYPERRTESPASH